MSTGRMDSYMFSTARFMLAVAVFSLLAMNVMSQGNSLVTISPEKLEFPAQASEEASPPQSLTLTNQSSSSLQISNILISGIDFSQSDTCDKPIAAGANCSIEVSFKPATSGTRLGALQIAWAGAGSPRTIPLTGIAP